MLFAKGTVSILCMKCSANKLFPKTCFNPTCKCKELKMIREVILRCSNCHCGVKVEERTMDGIVKSYPDNEYPLLTIIKNGQDES